ncbi:MAG: class I SAM-dependent methyltransferase [Halanaeroarchaeum sp.]
MRRFSAEYLRDTRRGLWEERGALSALSLEDRDRILDVGCGTGELTRVVREESTAEVVGLDVDRTLLNRVDFADALVQGDALSLPFAEDSFDLVVGQALLINLPDPDAAIREFARVSSDLVAAIEPDNARTTVESSVPAEGRLAELARRRYIAGVDTDVTLGSSVADRFEAAGLDVVSTVRHPLRRTTAPSYTESDVESAKRKASGTRIEEQRATFRAGGLSDTDVDELRSAWREMGRTVVEQMAAGEYEREAEVPFFVTVGRVS